MKKTVLVKGFFLVLFCMLITGCKKSKYDFDTPEAALASYQNFLAKIKIKPSVSTKEMISDIQEWQEFNDTVFNYFRNDSVFKNKQDLSLNYYKVTDSIRNEFVRLADATRFTYTDVYQIKLSTSPYRDDEHLKELYNKVEPFYKHLDSLQAPVLNKQGSVFKYRTLLSETLRMGINSKDDMLKFLTEEDLLWRSFLNNLYAFGDEDLSDISTNTVKVCKMIFQLPKMRKMESDELLVYMSMRSARRLIQNSSVCINDFEKYKMRSRQQGNAYLWMIIQPFTRIDPFTMATLTDAEKDDFTRITALIPQSIQFAKTFGIDQEMLQYLLPQQLLKMYLYTI